MFWVLSVVFDAFDAILRQAILGCDQNIVLDFRFEQSFALLELCPILFYKICRLFCHSIHRSLDVALCL